MKPPRAWSIALAAGLAVFAPSCKDEGEWPTRPITLICPWSAGGGTDSVSRQIALYLKTELGVPVAVTNTTGGSGVTGHAAGARARPDGTTLLMMTVEINMLHWRGLTRLTWEDYTPLVYLNRDAAAVFVHSESPYESAADLLEEARVNPGRLRASGTSSGGIWHLALAGWLSSSGLAPDAIRWIPYAGAGPSLNELASRGIDVVCCSVPEAKSFLESSADRPPIARCLGVMSDRPVRGFEDLPTFPSLGIDWTLGGWRGLVLPKDTPRPIVDRLVLGLERILRGEVEVGGRTFIAAMEAQGFDASWGGPAEFREVLASTDEKLGKLLTSPEFASLERAEFPLYGFPGMAGALFALSAGLILLVRSGSRSEGAAAARLPVDRRGLVHFVEVLVAVVAWIALAETLGFTVTTAAILLLLLTRLGVRLPLGIAISAVIVPLVFFVFATQLGVNLPRGPWGW